VRGKRELIAKHPTIHGLYAHVPARFEARSSGDHNTASGGEGFLGHNARKFWQRNLQNNGGINCGRGNQGNTGNLAAGIGRKSKAEYGSDLMAEMLRELGIKYIALNPGQLSRLARLDR